MPLQTGLQKRGSIYYFRARVPDDLQPYLGKEVKYSLKTKDRADANRKVREASVAFDQRCDALREQDRLRRQLPPSGPITDALIQQLCDLWRHMALAGDEENRIDGLLNDSEYLAERQDTDLALKETLGKTDLEAFEPALHQFLWLSGIPPIDPSRDGYRKLLYRFLQTAKSVHSEQLQRDAGEVVLTPDSPANDSPAKLPWSDTAQPIAGQGKGITLQDAFEDWKRYDPNRPDKTVGDVARLVAEFDAHTQGKPIEQIERAEVIAYRDALTARPLASKTVSKRINLLCALINTVIDSGKFKGVNPAQKIPKPPDDSVPREPFDYDELQRIFTAPVFRGERPFRRTMGETGYWMPILALYQGCRREELGQLLSERSTVSSVSMSPIWTMMATRRSTAARHSRTNPHDASCRYTQK
ncbi:MAG: hypothetical protein P8011_18565 [Acidihalobacter sp.]|uniref:DUF6538 domain-containing protein n=1 Tax=Acidihalobacter sp. TaxID=1872108 RepID=UPI00307DFC0A